MADNVVVSRTEFFELDPNKMLTLSVEIGDGQPGGTSVTLDGKHVDSGNDIVDLPIGSGKNLKGRELECTTTVKDESETTNRTSVVYTLKGGVKGDGKFAYDVTVSQPGGRAVYLISFMLQ